ncbi:DUF485 domain-containing protein [Kibdelosporangium philippinense]|uniref:DUF485 domain-containing protein n=1 Tax=Kibdelosporangium philippinense TaxID=211113 RepID=A0ABS8Z8Z9_9PSEU|nr:DUF485 domain-containing protein [Kibdelosporangium philippinense]MCE7003564.1 DUF485 domain-containing protein [Kibdelosporangium philippinense]
MKTMPSFSREHDFTEVDEGAPDFSAIAQSAEFVQLRKRIRRFVIPVTLLFLVWYLSYVVLAAYVPEFMSHRISDNITVGLLLGLSQFVSTVVIMLVYVRFAKRRIDPQTAQLRNQAGAGR